MKKKIGIILAIATIGCNAILYPQTEPQNLDVVLGGIPNTNPYFGTYTPAYFDPFHLRSGGTFLLASCGCGDWRVLYKPDDGSQQVQFPVQFYSDGDYSPSGPVTVFGRDEATGRSIRGLVDQDMGQFEGRADLNEMFQTISAQRGDAHDQPVIACGMCHIGDDSIYPLPPTHPQKYKTDPLVCLECHSVNGR